MAVEPKTMLGLAGSQRAGKVTDKLLAAAMEFASGKGYRTERVALRELSYSGCRACLACREGKAPYGCVVQDAMRELYPRILRAEGVILATPLHFSGFPGQVKSFLDRAQALWMQREELARGSWVLLFAAGGSAPYRRQFEGLISTMRAWARTLGKEYRGELLVPGTDEPGFSLASAIAQAEEMVKRSVGR